MFLHSGCWIPAALLLPNAIFLLIPPIPSSIPTLTHSTKWLETVEWISRIAVFLLPCFYPAGYEQIAAHGLVFAGMGIVLCFYYFGWLRYFLGRNVRLLYTSLAGIPYPMAVSPIFYLLLASVLVHSRVLAAFTALFGVAHITISHHTALQFPAENRRE